MMAYLFTAQPRYNFFSVYYLQYSCLLQYFCYRGIQTEYLRFQCCHRQSRGGCALQWRRHQNWCSDSVRRGQHLPDIWRRSAWLSEGLIVVTSLLIIFVRINIHGFNENQFRGYVNALSMILLKNCTSMNIKFRGSTSQLFKRT